MTERVEPSATEASDRGPPATGAGVPPDTAFRRQAVGTVYSAPAGKDLNLAADLDRKLNLQNRIAYQSEMMEHLLENQLKK